MTSSEEIKTIDAMMSVPVIQFGRLYNHKIKVLGMNYSLRIS